MNVVTALGDEKINILLRKEEDINVIGFDIQYQDGVFEFLEENKNIDFLILNINLIGNLNYEDLIENIKEKNKNIKLIIFLEKENIKINNYLIKNNINFILNKNDFNLENIIYILNNNNKINLINENNYLKNNNKEKINNNKLNNIFFIKYKNLFNKKIINIIKLIFNLNKIKNKLIKNNNYKINIILDIKINNKKNIFKTNKKISLIKSSDEIFNRDDLEKEIIKIIKEVF